MNIQQRRRIILFVTEGNLCLQREYKIR